MTDIKSREARSRNMAAIKNKDTKPEILIRKELFARGFRYRKNDSKVPGHPDIWLAKYNTAIFVHGCFWHRHEGCKYAYFPKSKTDFWEKKFQKNIERDRAVKEQLEKSGIRMLIIWECIIRHMEKDQLYKNKVFDGIQLFLESDGKYLEIERIL